MESVLHKMEQTPKTLTRVNIIQTRKYKRQITNIAFSFLKTIGLDIREEKMSAAFYVMPIILSINMVLISKKTTADNLYNFLHPLSFLNGTTNTLAIIWITYIKRKHIRKFLDNIDRDFEFPFGKTLPDFEKKKLSSIRAISIFLGSFPFFLASVAPITGWILNGKRSLMFPGWYPWNVDDNMFVYVATCVSQYINMIPCMAAFSFAMMYLMLSLVEFRRQIDKLKLNIEGVFQNVGISERSAGNARLKDCLRHHLFVLRSFGYFKPLFEMQFGSDLICGITSIATALFCLSEPSHNIGEKISLLGVLSLLLGTLFTRCYIGEELQSLNLSLSTFLYEQRWYLLPAKEKRLFHLFLTQTQHPLLIRSFGLYIPSRELFIRILSNSYSYYNLLRLD